MNVKMKHWQLALVLGFVAAGPSHQGGSAGLLAQELKAEELRMALSLND